MKLTGVMDFTNWLFISPRAKWIVKSSFEEYQPGLEYENGEILRWNACYVSHIKYFVVKIVFPNLISQFTACIWIV